MAFKGPKVLVPVVSVGIGTGTAVVRDWRTHEVVWFAVRRVKLVGHTVCVLATSHGVEDGLHRVTLPGGATAWVREYQPELDRAA